MTQVALQPRPDSRVTPIVVVAGVLAAATAAWIVLVARMAGMDAGPGGDPGTLRWFTATWALMTAAMMLPAAAPGVSRRARAQSSRAPLSTTLFVIGYASVWIVAGLAGYSLVQAIRAAHWHALAWSAGGSYLAGAAVAAAGLYQLTPAKRRWLERCGKPALTHGIGGSLLAGVEHGRCCLACCWTLMAALYALGMMSVTWTVLITVLIVAERLLPRPAIVRGVAAALIVLGIALAAAPASMPGLTTPGMRMQGMSATAVPPHRVEARRSEPAADI
jgi:hypothetical protein